MKHWRYTLTLPDKVKHEADKTQRLHTRIAKRKATKERIRRVPIERLESTEQSLLITACLRRGWKIWKLTSPGRRGWPDTFVVDPVSKRCAFIELKSKDRRSQASTAQKNVVQVLLNCGQNAFIATGYTEAVAYLEGIFK